MSMASGINRLIGLFVDTLKQFGKGRIWGWLLLYFLIDLLVLEAHYYYTSPILHGFMSHWTGLFSEEQVTGFSHYPGHFIMLPYFFEWGKLAVGLIIEGLLIGAAAILFYESYVTVPKEDCFKFKDLLPSWIHLVLAYLIMNGILVAVSYFVPSLLSEWLGGSPRRILFFDWILMPGIYVVIVSLFIYMVPSIAVYRDNVLQALARSLKTFFRNPFTTIIVVTIILAGSIIISNILSNTVTLVENFKPEIVYWILLGSLIVELIMHFLWMGTTVRLLVDEEE
ncbi:MAG: hypothetical protein ABIJ12_14470 [bacterium]